MNKAGLLILLCLYSVQGCFDDYILGEQTTIKFDECASPPGGQYLMDIKEIRLGNALFNTQLLKSMFYVGQPIQICMKGKFRRDVSGGLQSLQNSVHGDVALVGELVKVKYPFCDIDTVGCNSAVQPTCNAPIRKGDDFCYCSVLKEVPTSPDVNADVVWKILGNAANPNSCEKDFDVSDLIKAGKQPLACVNIPARVKNSPPPFFKSQKSQILARFG